MGELGFENEKLAARLLKITAGMIMGLKKIGWSLGLTKERRTELSDVLYETGRVTAKNYQGGINSLPFGIATGNIGLGIALSKDEEYNISFRGQRISFDMDDEVL